MLTVLPVAKIKRNFFPSVAFKTRRAFTFLEICLAVFIAMLIALVAVPSVKGILDEQRAKKSFEKFDALVREAQGRSVSEQRAYVMIWEKRGVLVRPQQPQNADESRGVSRIDFEENENGENGGSAGAIDIELPSALVKNPAKEWTFWPSGACEPAIISGADEAGKWHAVYDPLTTHGAFSTP